MRLPKNSFWPLGLAMMILLSVVLLACGPDTAAQSSTQAQAASTATPRNSTRVPATSKGTTATTPAATPLVPVGTPSVTPGGSVTIKVSPASVNVGNVTLSMSVQPARHMFDEESAVTAQATQQSGQQGSGNSKVAAASSAVFPGGMLGVTNNIDASQAAPADSAQGIIRHVAVQVKTRNGNQPVPYLKLSMDILLDGHPVLYDQALEPMSETDQTPPRFYYGNNVKFPQRGTYQIFIRTQPNTLLGRGQPQAAQFNLTVR